MKKEIIKKVVSFFKKEKIEKKDTNLNVKTESENTQDRNNKILYSKFTAQYFWRPRPESNWDRRICNPLRNHSATWPIFNKIDSIKSLYYTKLLYV